MYESISKDVGEGYRIVSIKYAKGGVKDGVIDREGNLIIKIEHRIDIPTYYYLTNSFESNSEKITFDDDVFDFGDINENKKALVAYIKAKSKNIRHSTKISKSK